jgi:hypothetical protein
MIAHGPGLLACHCLQLAALSRLLSSGWCLPAAEVQAACSRLFLHFSTGLQSRYWTARAVAAQRDGFAWRTVAGALLRLADVAPTSDRARQAGDYVLAMLPWAGTPDLLKVSARALPQSSNG